MPVGKMLSYFGIVPAGHFLDVPNAALGILYYLWQLFLGSSPYVPAELTQVITGAAFLSSVFLAYQLTFVIVELCVLCWSTHVINSILLYNMLQTRKRNNSKVKDL
jgi:vitamin-K-epoxide reductase (warfarin-sensitive)